MKNNMQYIGDFAARFDQHFSRKDHTVHSDYIGRIKGTNSVYTNVAISL